MAASIAEMLGEQIQGAPMPAKPVAPEKPSYGFSDYLLGALGAGPDKATPYRQAMTEFRRAESDYPMHTAQTVSALAQAEERRQNALRTTRYNELVSRAQADPNWTPSVSDMLVMSESAADFGEGRLRGQQFSGRAVLGDRNASPEDQFYAGQMVQGQVLPRLREVSGETVNLATDPAATFQTPAQQQDVAAVAALEGQRNRSPAAAGAAFGQADPDGIGPGGMSYMGRNAPAGQQFFKDPADGQIKLRELAAPTMGSRERAFAERVRVAAESVADTLENINAMPVGASLGIMGVGASPGKSVFASTKDTLRNAATSQSVQMYTAALAGANRALAVLESAGLAPSGTTMQSFESLAWREGDNEGSKLYKLAEMRQTVDNAMLTALTNPAITPEMKAQIETVRRRIAAAVPYSPLDIIQLEQADGAVTLADVLARRGIRVPAAGAQPAAPPASPGAAATAPATGGKPMPPENELADAAARRGVTVEALKAQLRAKGYQ